MKPALARRAEGEPSVLDKPAGFYSDKLGFHQKEEESHLTCMCRGLRKAFPATEAILPSQAQVHRPTFTCRQLLESGSHPPSHLVSPVPWHTQVEKYLGTFCQNQTSRKTELPVARAWRVIMWVSPRDEGGGQEEVLELLG